MHYVNTLVNTLIISSSGVVNSRNNIDNQRREQSLELNFKNRRFFPQLAGIKEGNTIFNNSLGIISRYFNSSKSFLRSKKSFMLTASYVRRLIIHLLLTEIRLVIKRTPLHLKNILRVLFLASNSLYRDPFGGNKVFSEVGMSTIFPKINYLYFVNSKPHGVVKKKKRGRLKRKVLKRVLLLNSILD
jgi:hypothetical protein